MKCSTPLRSIFLVGSISLGLIGVAWLIILALSPTQGDSFVLYATPQLGLTADHNLQVVMVTNPAQAAGIRPGDVLVQVGHSRLGVYEQAQPLVRHEIENVTTYPTYGSSKQSPEIKPLTVVVRRNSTELSFTFKPGYPGVGQTSYSPTVTPVPGGIIYL